MSPSRRPGANSGLLPHRTPVRFQFSNVPRCLPQTVTPRRNLSPRLFQGNVSVPQGEDRARGRALTRKGAPRTRCPSGRVLDNPRDRFEPVYRVIEACAIVPEPWTVSPPSSTAPGLMQDLDVAVRSMHADPLPLPDQPGGMLYPSRTC